MSEQKKTEFERPRMSAKREVFTTHFNKGELLSSFAKFEVKELARITRYASNVHLPSKADMEKYLTTLLYWRIQSVNGATVDKKYHLKVARVPARFATVLLNIGIAIDKTRNFKFVPATKITKKDIMSAEEFKDVSELLAEFYEEGYSTVRGLPKSEFGSIYLMAKSYISDMMMSMDAHHPVYAFLAAIVEAEVTHDTYGDLNMLFRVQYSGRDTYEDESFMYFKNIVAEEQRSEGALGVFNSIEVPNEPERIKND